MKIAVIQPRKVVWISLCLVFTVALLMTPHVANAGYLDPGSGSTAVQWIIASVAAISRLKDKIKNAISRLFRK